MKTKKPKLIKITANAQISATMRIDEKVAIQVLKDFCKGELNDLLKENGVTLWVDWDYVDVENK
jgi:hypothetical protein